MWTRQELLNFAELIDAFRVVPRTILIVYSYFVWYVINWYLPIANPTTGQTALVTTVAGSVPVVIGLYQNSGRRWGPHGNKSWKGSPPSGYAPTIVLPPVNPNINIGSGQGGKTAGPYEDSDLEG
jgi:hypothetical protein